MNEQTHTDRQMVAEAFRLLRKQGIAARMNFMCCQGCGFAAAPEGKPFVFYHNQDHEHAFKDRRGLGYRRETHPNIRPNAKLYISYDSPDEHGATQVQLGQLVKAALLCAGLSEDRIDWDGTPEHRIGIVARKS